MGTEIARLAERKETESKAQEEHLKTAREKQRFLLSFAEAYFIAAPEHRDFDGLWVKPFKSVMVTQTGDSIKGVWTQDNLEHSFTGKIHNRAAKIKYEYPWAPELKKDWYGYAYLSQNGLQLHILTIDGDTHSFEVLEALLHKSK